MLTLESAESKHLAPPESHSREWRTTTSSLHVIPEPLRTTYTHSHTYTRWARRRENYPSLFRSKFLLSNNL